MAKINNTGLVIGLGALGLILLSGGSASAGPVVLVDPDDPDDPGNKGSGTGGDAKGHTFTGEFPEPGGVDHPDKPAVFPKPGGGQVTGVQVLGELTKPQPTLGFLYQIRQGDNPANVAQRALGVPAGHPKVAPYLRSMVGNRWNWFLYATSSKQAYYAAQRGGVWGQLGGAFFPSNEPVAEAVANGRLPQRIIKWSRGPNGEIFKVSNPPHPVIKPKTWGRIMLPLSTGESGYDLPENNPTPLLAMYGQSASTFEGK